MRHLGIFSWFGYDLPLEERLELIAVAGFDSTFLWLGPEERLVERSQADLMPNLARRQGLVIDNVHASPTGCNALWADADADDTLEAYGKAISFAQMHGIPSVVIHVTAGSTPPPVGRTGPDRIRKLTRQAEQRGVVIAVENGGRPDYVDYILERCESPHLGFCYDSCHDLQKGTPPISILRRWAHRLVTVHLSDGHGERDDHLLPGSGKMDWDAVIDCFRVCGYSGPIMLETVPCHVRSMPPRGIPRHSCADSHAAPSRSSSESSEARFRTQSPEDFLAKAYARAVEIRERLSQQGLAADAEDGAAEG